MKHNMGTVDRIIRGLVAIVLAYLIFSKTVGGLLAVILGILAVVLLLAGIVAGLCFIGLVAFAVWRLSNVQAISIEVRRR